MHKKGHFTFTLDMWCKKTGAKPVKILQHDACEIVRTAFYMKSFFKWHNLSLLGTNSYIGSWESMISTKNASFYLTVELN